MPRGRKPGTKSKKSTKSASKPAEQQARRLNMPKQPILVKTCQELLAAIAAKETQVTLGDNIITNTNLLINHDLEIKFNGYSIISEESIAAARVLDIRSGKVTLSGCGKVFAMGARSVAVRIFGAMSAGTSHYTDVAIGKEISLYAPDSYGILISPNLGVAYGVNVEIAGQIMAHDGICVASGIHGDIHNSPHININKTAHIIADETIGVAIEAAGYGNWRVADATLHGAVGVMARTGILELNGPKILAHTGETFRIEDGVEKTLQLKLDGGAYLSERAAIIGGLAGPIKKLALQNSEFYSPLDEVFTPEIEACMTIKNCEFESDVVGFLDSLAMLETPAENMAEHDTEIIEGDDEVAADAISEATEDNDETIKVTKTNEVKASEAPVAGDDSEVLAKEIDGEEATSKGVTDAIELEQELEFQDLELLDEDDFVDEMFELDFDAEPQSGLGTESSSELQTVKPRVTKSNKRAKKSPKSRQQQSLPELRPAPKFTASLDFAHELTDAETDEQEILQALREDATEPSLAMPVIVRPPMPADIGEQEAAKIALADAIAEIRKLSADDYEVGFSELEQALKNAEQILAKPRVSLTAIRDAAAALLQAFDTLEEHDDMALSDAELDELFYQGAVLEEMLRPSAAAKSKTSASEAKLPTSRIGADSDSALVQTEIAKVASGARKPETAKLPAEPEPDFTVLSDALATISTLNLSKYTAASQSALLTELDQAQTVLMNLQSTQAEIDAVAMNLLAQMSHLETQPTKHAVGQIVAKTSTPAPVISAILPATMIDELSPVSTWSLGVTMIDELSPFVTDATTREKMLRAMRPHFKVILETLTRPFRKLARGIAAGIKAGMRAYRETLHANRV